MEATSGPQSISINDKTIRKTVNKKTRLQVKNDGGRVGLIRNKNRLDKARRGKVVTAPPPFVRTVDHVSHYDNTRRDLFFDHMAIARNTYKWEVRLTQNIGAVMGRK